MRTITGPGQRVVVVGAGLAGLATALHLTGAGRDVVVVESRDRPGGCAGQLSVGGYTFDTGPTVITAPQLIDDALGAVGERRADRLELIRLDPAYRAFFAGGEQLDVHADPEDTAASIAALAGDRAADGYRQFVGWTRALADAQWRDFIDRNMDSPIALLRPSLARLLCLGGLRGLDAACRRYLPDERVRRAFTFQSLYAGLSPYDARAIYAVIAYLDTVGGVYFPRGGVHEIPRALAAAAGAHGVDLRYRTRVCNVIVDGDRATGVTTAAGERIAADAVVIAADLPAAYRELLPRRVTPRRLRSVRASPSCVLLHVGSRGTDAGLAHHSIHFGAAWRQTFRELIDRRELMTDPSLLLGTPSQTDPQLAPPGRSSHYVLAPVPHLGAGLDWDVIGPRYRSEGVAKPEPSG
ncbi:MAG: phytoene desaturase family protein, partial [Mycobacteriales bacterium]